MKNITCFNLSFLVKFFLFLSIFVFIRVVVRKNFNYANASNHSKIKLMLQFIRKLMTFHQK